jgi:septal ring factor EnvC (AmiA/AmiB activator)
MIPDLLARVANTIVAASDFAKEVGNMRVQLDLLNHDLNNTRQTNVTLQETISSVSAQRDEAQAKVREQTDALLRLETDKVDAFQHLERTEREADELQTKLDMTRAERDNYGIHNMELEDEVQKLKAKLAKFQRVFEETMGDGEAAPEAPAPLPEASKSTTPSSEPSPSSDWSNPAPEPIDLPPLPTVTRSNETDRGYYQGHDKFSWGNASAWDSERNEWFVPRSAVA